MIDHITSTKNLNLNLNLNRTEPFNERYLSEPKTLASGLSGPPKGRLSASSEFEFKFKFKCTLTSEVYPLKQFLNLADTEIHEREGTSSGSG